MASVGIQSLSPEAFGIIMTNELAQVSCDLQRLRLCYTPEGSNNVWTDNNMQNHTQSSTKAEILRRFILALPVELDDSLPLSSHFRSKRIQFCDAVIVLELNLYVKMLHLNSQMENGWTLSVFNHVVAEQDLLPRGVSLVYFVR